jgi:hypothetical protein
MMRTLVTLVLVLAGYGCKSAPDTSPGDQKPDQATGVAAFATVRTVLQHPRCQNCHPAGDAPLQGDEGRVHAMNVLRGPTGHGMAGAECTTCHGLANPPSNYGLHVPPGVPKAWHMPKPEEKLVFVGVEPRALCEQIKDPARNGGMDMAALRVHLEDPLVKWGWNPGFGRAPVSTPYETFIAAWETWAAAGAPCPN